MGASIRQTLRNLFELTHVTKAPFNSIKRQRPWSAFLRASLTTSIYIRIRRHIFCRRKKRQRAEADLSLSLSLSHTAVYDLQTTAIIPLNVCWQHITFIAVQLHKSTCMQCSAERADCRFIAHHNALNAYKRCSNAREEKSIIKHIVVVTMYTCFSWTAAARKQIGSEEAQM